MQVNKQNIVFPVLLLTTFSVRIAWSLYNPVVVTDSSEYLTIAKNILENRTFSLSESMPYIPTNWRAPVYPFFIAMLWKLFGESNNIIFFAQAIISTATIYLLYLMAKRGFDLKVANISILLNCLLMPGIVLSGSILSETVYSFLIVLGLWAAFYPPRDSLLFAPFAGLFFGFATLTRTESLLYPLLAVLVLALVSRPISKRTIIRISLLLIMHLIIVSCWMYRNNLKFDEFTLVNPVLPYRGLIGGLGIPYSDPIVKGYYDFKYSTDKARLEQYKQNVTSYYINYIKEHPVSFVGIRMKQMIKLWLYGGSYEKWNWKKDDYSYIELFHKRKWGDLTIRLATYLIFGLLPMLTLAYCLFRSKLKLTNHYKDIVVFFSFPVYITILTLPLETDFRYALPGQMVLAIVLSAILKEHVLLRIKHMPKRT